MFTNPNFGAGFQNSFNMQANQAIGLNTFNPIGPTIGNMSAFDFGLPDVPVGYMNTVGSPGLPAGQLDAMMHPYAEFTNSEPLGQTFHDFNTISDFGDEPLPQLPFEDVGSPPAAETFTLPFSYSDGRVAARLGSDDTLLQGEINVDPKTLIGPVVNWGGNVGLNVGDFGVGYNRGGQLSFEASPWNILDIGGVITPGSPGWSLNAGRTFSLGPLDASIGGFVNPNDWGANFNFNYDLLSW